MFDSTIPYDVRFFQSLDRIVQGEPWIERDRAMIDPLQTIGIEKGKPFTPDAKTNEILDAAAGGARSCSTRSTTRDFPPFYEGSYWFFPALPEACRAAHRYADPEVFDRRRGFTYTYGFIGIKRLGTGQFYLMAVKDRTAQPLDGGKTYRLTVPVNRRSSSTGRPPPTTADPRSIRDMPRKPLFANPRDAEERRPLGRRLLRAQRPRARNQTGCRRSGGQFEVMFRLYGPRRRCSTRLGGCRTSPRPADGGRA